MDYKKYLILLSVIVIMIGIIDCTSALKIKHSDYNNAEVYHDGYKMVKSKGYEYHSGKLHKNVKYSGYNQPNCYNGYNKKCKWYGRTSIGEWWVQGSVSEIKKAKYGSIKVNGKYVNKKFKLYYDERWDGKAKFPKFYPTNVIKGNLKGKTVTLGVHDRNGKVLATKSFKVKRLSTYFWAGA